MIAHDIPSRPFTDLSPLDVYSRPPGGPRLVDVREAHELDGELGHIRGVEHVPLATVAQAAAAWDRDAEIVVICRSGGRSARAAEQLAALGFRRVLNMAGGMLAWNAAGLPVERKAA